MDELSQLCLRCCRDHTLSKEPDVFWNFSGVVKEMAE